MKSYAISMLGLSCLLAGATASAAEGEAPKPPAAAVEAGKKIDWAKMDTAARKKYMKGTVLPQMKKLFVAFDKKRYAKMNCATCHGQKATEVSFKMPSEELPKLPQPTDSAGFAAIQEKKPEVAKFMGMQVKPTMAALLGKAEWSPTTPDGFGCYGCHTQQPAAAAPAAPATVGNKPAPGAPAPTPTPVPPAKK